MDLFFLLEPCDQLLLVQVQAQLAALQTEDGILPAGHQICHGLEERNESSLCPREDDAEARARRASVNSGCALLREFLVSPPPS